MPSWRGIGIGCESFKKQPELSESRRSNSTNEGRLPTYSVEKLLIFLGGKFIFDVTNSKI